MGMSVGNAGDCLIQCWTKELLGERIAKETNVGVQDPIPGQFPQCCLRHPVRKYVLSLNVMLLLFVFDVQSFYHCW